jgi:predicted ATPase
VWFVPLATLLEPEQVESTIADHVGLREIGTRPVPMGLSEYLRAKRALLVLDNFEHLLTAAPVIGELLGACPRLLVLVTSRAALRISGEYEYAVPPLELPGTRLPAVHVVAEVAAVQLFMERAKAIDASFTVSEENAPARG